jgi:hypothetical protein
MLRNKKFFIGNSKQHRCAVVNTLNEDEMRQRFERFRAVMTPILNIPPADLAPFQFAKPFSSPPGRPSRAKAKRKVPEESESEEAEEEEENEEDEEDEEDDDGSERAGRKKKAKKGKEKNGR